MSAAVSPSSTLPDPLRPAALPAPERSLRIQLLEALRQQDHPAVARLSARWAHRHGVEALERLIHDQSLLEPGRIEEEPTAAAITPPPQGSFDPGEQPMEGALEGTLSNPPAQGFHPIRRLKTLVRDCIDEVASTFQGETDQRLLEENAPVTSRFSLVQPLEPTGPVPLPAPPPVHPDLADLRSWLPDHQDDHQRRAS
ncbi:MAG: hypothetical protein DCF24_06815 [Cyanobium sp.]|nr:MAG: hypothetical protein DCF24_06815 [Cyanobium sp.]